MKIVSWNIRHGGTKSKQPDICNQLESWEPDVVGLSEFRESATSQAIAASLAKLGLTYQLTTAAATERGRNFLLLASRFPLKAKTSEGLLKSSGRWLHATARGISIMLMHVPNRSGAKWQFHAEVIEQLAQNSSRRAIAMGDTNTGRPGLDEENKFFYRKEGAWLDAVESAGWVPSGMTKRGAKYYANFRFEGKIIRKVLSPNLKVAKTMLDDLRRGIMRVQS